MSESAELTAPLVKMFKQAGVFCLRMNSGTIRASRRFIKLHEKGTADILCFPPNKPPTWIETKTGRTNKEQVIAQGAFKERVESLGHVYITVNTLDEGLEAIR